LQSVQDIADEIWVVDSFSTDKTKEICLSYSVQFIEHRFEGHIQQINFAAQNATYNYVLSFDADEVLSPQLIKSIKEVKLNFEADGYYFNRLNNYCRQWIKHCGWYPDKKLRIWDRRNLMFIPNRIDS
jgi:glycosyltransferase involved in cell wall biosynthesis